MSLPELSLVAVSLSMDAFAVSISKGLSLPYAGRRHMLAAGFYFGIFQAGMPVLGYLVYRLFQSGMLSFAHWIASILLCAIGGIAVKPKAWFTRICAVWMAFSLLLLGIVGWGTIDNGLMLYTLYFGWAFVAMAFQLGDWLLHRWKIPEIVFFLLLILAVGITNVTALKAALVFSTQFFPALR